MPFSCNVTHHYASSVPVFSQVRDHTQQAPFGQLTGFIFPSSFRKA